MIYITGDLHGDLSRFRSREFRKIKRNDTLVICGDFGFLWQDTEQEKRMLKWIGKRRYTVLFIDGIHDNLHMIRNYPETDWNGGKVREISGHLRYLSRGSVFTIEDKKIFAFGGGENRQAREQDHAASWWELQLPSLKEIEIGRKNLKKADNRIDYVVTHQGSRQTKKLLTMKDDEANILDTFLNEVRDTATYQGWFFGNYHIDKILPPKEMAVFRRVVPLKNTFKESVARRKR